MKSRTSPLCPNLDTPPVTPGILPHHACPAIAPAFYTQWDAEGAPATANTVAATELPDKIPATVSCAKRGQTVGLTISIWVIVLGMDWSMIEQMRAGESKTRRLKVMFAERSVQNKLLKAAFGKQGRGYPTL